MAANVRPGRDAVCISLICAVILAGCSTQTPASPALPTVSPPPALSTSPTSILETVPPGSAVASRLDVTTCPFDLPAGFRQGKEVDCGFVAVPQRHSQPTGSMIRIAVARFHSLTSTPDPVPAFYLSGGPGGKNQGLVTAFSYAFTGVIGARDIVVFDQRGIGKSQPALDCPEVLDQTLLTYAQPLSITDASDRSVAAALRCRDRLVQQGIDVAAYTGAEDAADVNDLRLALGYGTIDLLGISYGTRLALTVLRDFPTIVHSAVLDSVVPMQESLYRQRSLTFDRALNLLFTDCASDTRCATAFPTLRSDFSLVVRQLNAQPVTVTVTDPARASHDLIITGDRFVFSLFDWLYSPSALQYVPAAIAQLKAGTHTLLAQLIGGTLGKTYSVSIGMNYSVVCHDWVPFERYDDVVAAAQGVLPEIRDVIATLRTVFGVCDQWPQTAVDPREHQAVMSDVPTLVLESANDPVTPPVYGQEAAKTLSRSIYVETPGIGHSVVGNGGGCVQTILQAFYADPTHRPPTACTAGLGVLFVTSI